MSSYFPDYPDYAIGTDADHLPIVPDDFMPDMRPALAQIEEEPSQISGDPETYKGARR